MKRIIYVGIFTTLTSSIVFSCKKHSNEIITNRKSTTQNSVSKNNKFTDISYYPKDDKNVKDLTLNFLSKTKTGNSTL